MLFISSSLPLLQTTIFECPQGAVFTRGRIIHSCRELLVDAQITLEARTLIDV